MRAKVIRWTEEERNAVFIEYFKMKRAGTLPSNAEKSWQSAQVKALKDKSRHRSLNASSTASVLTTSFNRIQKEIALQVSNKRSAIIVASPLKQALPDQPKPLLPPPTATLGSIDSLIDEIVEKRINSLLPILMAEMSAIIKSAFDIQGEKIDNSLRHNYQEFMRYLDPKWGQEVQETAAVPDVVQTTQTEIVSSVEKRRNPVMILVNAKRVQADSIRKQFPNLEVHITDGKTPTEENPLLVVGFSRWMPHSLVNSCKAKFGEKYVELSPKASVSQAKAKIQQRLSTIDHYLNTF